MSIVLPCVIQSGTMPVSKHSWRSFTIHVCRDVKFFTQKPCTRSGPGAFQFGTFFRNCVTVSTLIHMLSCCRGSTSSLNLVPDPSWLPLDKWGICLREPEALKAYWYSFASSHTNPAASWLMKTCTCPIEITEQRAQRLQTKMRRSELYCSKIARTSAKAGKTKLLQLALFQVQEIISQQAFNWSFVGWALCFTSLRWTEIAIWRTSVATRHVNVVWAFLQM